MQSGAAAIDFGEESYLSQDYKVLMNVLSHSE